MREFDLLVEQLNRCAKYPAMYGTPENLLCACKYLSHIAMSILDDGWRLQSIERLWAQVVDELDVREYLRSQRTSHELQRRCKWGEDEHLARRQVLEAFGRIWQSAKSVGDLQPHTARWIDLLLEQPASIRCADDLEVTLWCMIAVATNENKGMLRSLWEAELRSLSQNPARSLSDVGTEEEWCSRQKHYQHDFPSYDCISRIIGAVVDILDAKRQQFETT